MLKFAKFLATLAFVMLSGLNLFAEEAPSHGRPDLAFGLEFKLTQSFLVGGFGEVNNVPLGLRQVPSHKDDTWIYGSNTVIRTIPFDSYSIYGGALITPAVSPEITINRLRLRAGVNFSFPNQVYLIDTNSLKEINQYGGTERGTGTSLVYYGIRAGKDLRPGFLTEAEFELGKGFNILAGSDISYYKIVLESGWDRHDRLEKYKTYDLSRNKMRKVYGGIEIQPFRGEGGPAGFHVVVGKVRGHSSLVDEGSGVIIRREGDWFVGFGISVHAVFFKK